MNREHFAHLAAKARSGDTNALEQLLIQAYTPVSYQCRKLLQNDRAAESVTRNILLSVHKQLPSLEHPEHFEKWLNRLTAKRCLRMLNENPPEKTQPRRKLEIPEATLDEQATAKLVDQIVDALPDGPRICLVLYCCSEILPNRIAPLTGFSEETVESHLNQAQTLINSTLEQLYEKGVQFAPITSLPEILQIAMYTTANPNAAAAMAGAILEKQASKAVPVPVRKFSSRGLRLAVIAAAAVILLTLGTVFALERSRQEPVPEEPTTAVTETTPPETEATTVPTTEATTVETTEEPTVPTTAAETTEETRAEATEAPTQAATKPASGQQSQPNQGGQSSSGGGNTSSGSSSGNSGNGGTSSGNSSGSGGTHVHSYQDAGPIGATSAGCESPGWRTKICFVCGDQVRYQDPENAPPLGHSYSSKVKPPTTDREGYTIHTCSRCGVSYTDNYVPKLPAETQPPETQPPETQPPATQPPAETPEETPNETPDDSQSQLPEDTLD